MTTKAEIIQKIKLEHPTLKKGTDETGYEVLSSEEYETTISEWADYQLEKEKEKVEALQAQADKAAAQAKLAALGLTANDLKALGL